MFCKYLSVHFVSARSCKRRVIGDKSSLAANVQPKGRPITMSLLNLQGTEMQSVQTNYQGKRILVTGGLSFISSHLVEALVALGAQVRIADDLSSGRLEHIEGVQDDVEVCIGDLRDTSFAQHVLNEVEIVFHLAADHGGRGYIETHPVQCLGNMALDHVVFSLAAQSGVRRIIHASSACAYPVGLQDDADDRSLLSEEQAGFDVAGQAFADGAYGWAKLMGEYQLANVVSQFGLGGVSCRIFTAYGQRENESHAVVALMAKAFRCLDPYPVWGDGTQTRNFTYVTDTAMGMLLAGAKLCEPGTFDVLNVGTDTHSTINELISEIFECAKWRPQEIDYELDKPVGVKSRAADCTKSEKLLGWRPSIPLAEGVRATYEWYKSSANANKDLDHLLMSR
jgi:nucleoside-diphosphate-sugar epimerase